MTSRSDGTIRILIVEDDPTDRKTLTRELAGSSLGRVTTRQAASLAEALASLQTDRPDLVLLDLGLPDSSGLESLGSLAPWTEEIPGPSHETEWKKFWNVKIGNCARLYESV